MSCLTSLPRAKGKWMMRFFLRLRAGRRSLQRPTPWTEDQLLGLVKSMSAMRTIRHQPRALRQCTSAILRNFLHHHSRCHTQWVKRRDLESLQAEFAAARAMEVVSKEMLNVSRQARGGNCAWNWRASERPWLK